ncbi:MAG: hypothetical protein ABIO46_14320 [Chitinophagales bacterium]
MTETIKLTLVRIIHTAVWVFMVAVLIYIYYAVISNKVDYWLWICFGIIFAECIVLVIFRMSCPLTLIARKFSASTKENFDIYLPNWLARHNKLIFTILMVLIIGVLAFRLINRE